MQGDDTGAGGATGPFDYYPASPETVWASADELTAAAGQLDLLVGDVCAAHAPARSGVAGLLAGPMAAAPAPVRSDARRILLAALCAGGAVRAWGDAVQQFDRAVDGLNMEWTAAGAAARAGVLGELRRRYAAAESALDDAAALAARRLDEGPTRAVIVSLFAGGLLPHEVVAAFPRIEFEHGKLPYDLAALAPDVLARLVVESAVDIRRYRLPASVVQAIGRLLADIAKGTLRDSDADSGDLADLDSLLWRLGEIDGVDAAFVERLGGQGLLDLASGLAFVYPHSAVATGLIRTLKATTESATKEMTATQQRALAAELLALPQRAATILASARPLALSYFLQDGHYATELLDTIGRRLDVLERRAGLGLDHWNNTDVRTGMIASVLFDSSDASISDRDVMASYMSALGNNGEAALNFFTADDQGAGSRAEYYLKYRHWAHDRFDSLLAAVDAATTDPHNDYAGRRGDAAGLMSSVVDYLAHRHQVYGNPDARWVDELGDSPELFVGANLSDAAAVRMAHMLGEYLPAVDQALDDGIWLDQLQAGHSTVFEARGLDRFGVMPEFERGELAVVTEATLGSDHALLTLTDAVRDYQHAQLDQGSRADGTIRQDYVDADARLRGFLVHSTNGAEITEAEAKDQDILDANGRKLAAIRLTSFTVGQMTRIPNPYSVLVGGGILAGSDGLAHLISDDTHWRDGAVDAANSEAQAVAERSQSMLTHLLYDRGVYDRHDLITVVDKHHDDDRPLPTKTQVREWFSDGYPSPHQVGDDPNDRTRLNNLLDYALAPKGVDIEAFGERYDTVFEDRSIDDKHLRREE